MGKFHDLKIWPEFFDDIKSGAKPFELRKNDRNYQVGDFLILKEWSPDEEEFTGVSIVKEVTYILSNAEKFGLMDKHVILGLK